MAAVRFSGQAREDLREIVDFIAQDDQESARRVFLALEERCRALADMPRMGRDREEIDRNLRSLPCLAYVIFYYPIRDGVAIARIYHSSRDPDATL